MVYWLPAQLEGKVGGSAANNAEDILKNLQVNKQDRSSLKQGGTLTLAATALGPNFNLQTQSGYTSSNLDALAPCNIPAVMGFYTMSPEGEGTLNPEFCTEHKTETVNGVQTATFKINPQGCLQRRHPHGRERCSRHVEGLQRSHRQPLPHHR